MKKIIFFVITLFYIISCKSQDSTFSKEVENFQHKLNLRFATKGESPLTKRDFKNFKRLDFFPISEKYRVFAHFRLTPKSRIFQMKTTTERSPLYRVYGVASFIIDGKRLELNIYQNQKTYDTGTVANYLFLPYKDLTNGKTSYGGGRYINLAIPPINSDIIVIDFNKSYNPYCAYNQKYSCPIVPPENSLDIKIEAGVKAFKK